MSLSALDQPRQFQVKATSASGVLTITFDLFCNPTVATSLQDAASATTTLTNPASGQLHGVLVITPNSAVTSEGDSVNGSIANILAPSA